MSMTNEQIQALAARLWLKANEAKQSDDWGCDSDNFHDVATPDSILSLLAERDADKALIAEQEKRIAELEQKHCGGALMEREEHHVGVVNKLLERIAELEACVSNLQVNRPVIYGDGFYAGYWKARSEQDMSNEDENHG